MCEWKTCRLGDIVRFSSGGTPSKKNEDYWNGNIPWISAKTMKSEFLSSSDLYITSSGLKHGSKLAPKGSILLLTRGSGLFNNIPVCYVERPVAFNQDVKCIESVSNVENKYIFYWLIANRNRLQQQLDVTGIGAGKFSTKFLAGLKFSFPDEDVRKKIIAVADNITKKYLMNARINKNLVA